MSRRQRLTLLALGIFGFLAAYMYSHTMTPSTMPSKSTAIIIGSGLAGLSAASELISHRIPVVMLERAAKPGGNSMKASSGINGAPTKFQPKTDDAFYSDSIRSAGKAMNTMKSYREKLISTLVNDSSSAITWLTETIGVDLSRVAQLGGHTVPRTHRPSGTLPPGYSIVSALLKSLNSSPLFNLQTSCTVTTLLKSGSKVNGVSYLNPNGTPATLHGPVIVAGGGFGGDSTGLLAKYRPDLANYPSTNEARPGVQPLLTAVGAQLLDMDLVQVHPTGFVDPASPFAPVKFLAAEMLRGEGGILITPDGKRFVNELDTREEVTNAITALPMISDAPKQWDVQILLDKGTYGAAKSHVDFYISKGLIRKATIAELGAEALDTIIAYANAAAEDQPDKDVFGRSSFGHWSLKNPDLKSVVYVGRVTPVIHFTMGGVVTSTEAEVLDEKSEPIEGVWAAGEVVGGVHGGNRLGGSSLLECVVFGRRAGRGCVEYVEKGK